MQPDFHRYQSHGICFRRRSEQNRRRDEEQLHNAERTSEESSVRYPGEGMLSVRKKSMIDGILIEDRVWNEVKVLSR